MTAPRLFGTVQRNKERQWLIKCEPQVTIKLKRLFEKIDKATYGYVIIKDTREVCRDLQWILERWPMEISAYDRRYISAKAAEHRRLEQDVSAIAGSGYQPREYTLALPPREYQRVAADMLERRGSLLLADQLGVGKTVSAICSFMLPDALPALIVVPKHLQRQWQREINRFAPGLSTHIIRTGKPYDLTKVGRRTLPYPDVIICTYMKLVGWADELAGTAATIVWDECVTADTEIQRWPLNTGSTEIVDLVPGDRVAAFNSNGEIVEDEVVGVTPKGRKLVWRLSFADGRHLDCSENERIFTDRGWMYARDIIDETVARDSIYLSDSAYRECAPGRTRFSPWGCPPRLQPEASAHQIPPWSKAEGIPTSQGVLSEGLHPFPTLRSDQSGIRHDFLDLPVDHDSGIRVFAFPMRQGRQESHYPGMVRPSHLGRDSVLVHGRWSPPEKHDGDQHPWFQRARGHHAGSITRRQGSPSGHRLRPDSVRTTLLDVASTTRLGRSVDSADHAVRAVLHGVQDSGGTTAPSDPLQRVWQVTPSQEQETWVSGLLSDEGVPQGSNAPTLQGRQIAKAICLGYRDVYDVETLEHHTVIANGFAVHNCQELRHVGTKKYIASKYVADKAERRLGLSATPIHGYGGELWNVFNVLAPDELGTSTEFAREWCKSEAGYGNATKLIVKEPAAFGMYLREQGLMLRRTRSDVKRELPPLTKIVQQIDCDAKPIDDLKTAAAELARIILSQGRGIDKMRAAEELDWRMRQATGIAKSAQVADFVRMLVENDEPVILAAWHREVHSLLMERLNDLKPVMYTGSESLPEKERARQSFIDGESNILLISLRSGAGLDGLQSRARTVVHAELDWAAAVHDQLDGRAHRDGQTEPVTAYYLLADSGSDPVIADALGLKRQQLDGMLDPGADASPIVGANNTDRLKRLAESVLEQHGKRRVEDPVDREEEEAA